MRARYAFLALPCITVALLSPPAAAQTAPEPPPPAPAGAEPPPSAPSATDARALAEMLFFTGRGLMEAGRYVEACAKLSESYRLDAAPGTLLNLAVCNEKAGKTASAWGEFRDALAEARRMNRPDREKLASEHIAALEPELAYLTVTVPTAVRRIHRFEFTRNGIPLQSAAWDTDLPVDPGDVEVVERAPLYRPKTLHVTVAPKQHATLAAVPLELAPVDRSSLPFWTAKRTTGLLIAGAGVGAAVVGAVFGMQAINSRKASDAACPNDFDGDPRCNQAGVNAMNKAQTESWVSDVAFGLAAVGVGFGGYYLVSGGAKDPAAETAAGSWSWRASVVPGGAAGMVSGSF